MEDKLWSYRELKHLVIHDKSLPDKLASELNRMFHGGEIVRTAADISKIRSKRTILDWNRESP